LSSPPGAPIPIGAPEASAAGGWFRRQNCEFDLQSLHVAHGRGGFPPLAAAGETINIGSLQRSKAGNRPLTAFGSPD
jgi:hypothetical protein